MTFRIKILHKILTYKKVIKHILEFRGLCNLIEYEENKQPKKIGKPWIRYSLAKRDLISTFSAFQVYSLKNL